MTRTNQKDNTNHNAGVNPPIDTFNAAAIIPMKKKTISGYSSIS
jgi:hypothetical protein